MSNNDKIVVMDSSSLFFSGLSIILKNSHRKIELTNFFKTKNDLYKYVSSHCVDMVITNVTHADKPFKAIKEIVAIKTAIPAVKIFVYSEEENSFLIRMLFNIGVSAIVSRRESSAKLADFIYYAMQGEFVYSQLYIDSLARDNQDKLTDLELGVLLEFHNGLSLTRMSQMFHQSIKTISNSKYRAMKKLGISDKLHLLSM